MKIREVSLQGTTASGGGLTLNASEIVFGKLYAVQWIDGDLANGVDAVISCQDTDSSVAQTLLTLTDANDDKWYYPRNIVHGPTGADLTYDGTRTINDKALCNGKLRLAIADGGNKKSGGAIIYIEVPDR